MACITSSPVLPAIWSGRATPGPGPAARRCRISCSWASQVSRLSFALMGCSITVAYAFIVDTIKGMSPVTTASNPTTTAVKPQGCTNLKLRQLMRRVAQHYDNEVGKSGLKGTQYSLLSYVVKLGPIRAVDLAAEMKVSTSTLSRNLQPLVAAGWLVAGEHPCGGGRAGPAVPVAGVLHQVQLGQQGVGPVAFAALRRVVHRQLDAAGVDAHGFTQVETGARQPAVGVGQGDAVDAERCGRVLGQAGGEALELAGDRGFGGRMQLPDLLAALGVFFAQCPHVALAQAFHQLFDLELAEMAPQQQDALALVRGLEDEGAGKGQQTECENIHGETGAQKACSVVTAHGAGCAGFKSLVNTADTLSKDHASAVAVQQRKWRCFRYRRNPGPNHAFNPSTAHERLLIRPFWPRGRRLRRGGRALDPVVRRAGGAAVREHRVARRGPGLERPAVRAGDHRTAVPVPPARACAHAAAGRSRAGGPAAGGANRSPAAGLDGQLARCDLCEGPAGVLPAGQPGDRAHGRQGRDADAGFAGPGSAARRTGRQDLGGRAPHHARGPYRDPGVRGRYQRRSAHLQFDQGPLAR